MRLPVVGKAQKGFPSAEKHSQLLDIRLRRFLIAHFATDGLSEKNLLTLADQELAPRTGVPHDTERPTADRALRVDITLASPSGKKIAVEVDGPQHYTTN